MKHNLFFLSAMIIAAALFTACRKTTPTTSPGTLGFINTIAGNGSSGFSGDGGIAVRAQLNAPIAVAVNNAVNIYIADYNNNRIRQVTPAGIISTIAGKDTAGYSGDGGPAIAAKITVTSICVDASGNIYITDASNRIRKINTAGIISTIAGIGTPGYTGDGGPAISAQLNYPGSIAVDNSGNVFFADGYNNVVRQINTSGVISTVAGNAADDEYSGDGGPATNAGIRGIGGVALDATGNIYIADVPDNRVRMVNKAGIITTFAGNGYDSVTGAGGGFKGDGGQATAAELYHPISLAIDVAGNVYIADAGNYRIRMVNTSGIITTIAGNGVQGYLRDACPATATSINAIDAIAVDKFGNIYLPDDNADRVRKVNNLLY